MSKNFCATCGKSEIDMIKYQVVRCDTAYAEYYDPRAEAFEEGGIIQEHLPRKELECTILGTFACKKSAVEFMGMIVDKHHKSEDNSGWKRVYHDNINTISIYHCGIMGGKYLICKYHILEFKDVSISSDQKK